MTNAKIRHCCARRFMPLIVALFLTAGLSVIAFDRAPAAPRASHAITVQFPDGAHAHPVQWNALAPEPANAAEDSMTTRLVGVGVLGLGLAASLAVVLIMFDQTMRVRGSQRHTRHR